MPRHGGAVQHFGSLAADGSPLDTQGEPIVACIQLVPEGGRSVAVHICGRKLKGDPEFPYMCAIHIGAIRRQQKKEAERKATKDSADEQSRLAAERVTKINAALGLNATVQHNSPWSGPERFIHRPTGNVIVSIDELESLLARVGTPACDHSEMVYKTGQICSCGKFVG